ncbi:hypothetical protein SULZ_12805 [Saccharolobus solfataricus]|uniref:Uncharacterized protein n=1 Tax=Saccharolobus solfataricus TaxID=2287 RepID=A0A3G8ETE1_SACSO|nr:hypothetical protein SULZ_12805 [Saccharolobus solfataricus]
MRKELVLVLLSYLFLNVLVNSWKAEFSQSLLNYSRFQPRRGSLLPREVCSTSGQLYGVSFDNVKLIPFIFYY